MSDLPQLDAGRLGRHWGAIALGALALDLGCAPPETIFALSPRTVTASLDARSTKSPSTSIDAKPHWVDLRSDRSLLCARDGNGKVSCWFLETASPCKAFPCSEPAYFRAKPFPVPPLDATEMAVAFPRTWVVRKNGDVAAVSTISADDVPRFHGAVELDGSGGVAHSAPGGVTIDSTCARVPTNEVRCQLLGTDLSIPVDTTAITVGGYHACGIRPVTRSRTVVCWGSNHVGQLGDGTRRASLVAVVVRGLADVIQIDAAHHSTCALREDGKVACWGRPGGSESAVHSTPVLVPDLSNVVEVSMGESHLCARLRSGRVTCVGRNDKNQLGTRTPSDDVGRSTIQGLDEVVKITSLGNGTCALRADDSIVCWGLGVPPETLSLPEDPTQP